MGQGAHLTVEQAADTIDGAVAVRDCIDSSWLERGMCKSVQPIQNDVLNVCYNRTTHIGFLLLSRITPIKQNHTT